MPDAPLPTLAVISHLYPQRTREGYGVFVSEQVRALAEAGAPIAAVVVPVPWAPWPLPALKDTWRQYASAEHHRVDFGHVAIDFPRHLSFPRKMLTDSAARSALKAIAADAPLMERLAKANVIVAHTALLDGQVARELSRRLRVPYVVVVHGEDLYQNVRDDASGKLRSAVGEVLAGAAAVIGVSSAVASGLHDAFPSLGKVLVLHNGVDTTLFSPAEEPAEASAAEAIAQLGSPERPLRLLTAGHLVTRKAHAFVLQAVAKLAANGLALDYTIAGDGPERARLEDLARRLGVAGRTRFLGAYRHEELPTLLRECDLLAMPSWDEAFGVVYIEALATGVPVIAASDEGARDIVENGTDGYLMPPRDAAAIAASIAAFASLDPAARHSMREAARSKSLRFTWEENARRLLEIVRNIADPPQGG